MSRRQKLLQRVAAKPKDFRWTELQALLEDLGYTEESNDGSRRKFYNEKTGALITIHKPHPHPTLKAYQVRDVVGHLKERGYLG